MALLGVCTIVALLLAIMLDRCSPLVALILVPVAASLIGGFGLGTVGFIVAGVTRIAPNAVMFMFAILFFGVMTDAGLLDPLIVRVLRLVGHRPARIVAATALLALVVHLDGSGAVCFMVVIPVMLPLYDKLGLDRRVLACAASMAAGVNFLPWTGPMVRASAALHVPVLEIFRPMIPAQIVGLVFVFATAWWLGKREELRIETLGLRIDAAPRPVSMTTDELRRPRLFLFNLVLTLTAMVALVSGLANPAVVFMVAAAAALLLNYANAEEQRRRIDAHARPALMMASILLAAGVFTGIMDGTGALKALAQAGAGAVPAGMGAHIPLALSLIAMPLSMIFDPDSFYFGVMPVIVNIHSHFGGAPVQVAQAALVGQMTAGFPVSPLTPATFLVAGLSGIELSAHQRFSFLYLYAGSLVMALSCILFGLFPL